MVDDIISIGDTIVFTDNGGYCNGSPSGSLILNKEYKIKGLNIPFRSKGSCDAILEDGTKVRLSDVYDNGYYKDIYEKYFYKAYSKSYELW